MNSTARSRPTSAAGAAALLLALVAMLLAFMPVLQAPAHAVQVCDNEEDGCAGPPSAECFGLEYLNKFGFDDEAENGGSGFDQGETTENEVAGDDTYSFTGTTAAGAVTVTYTVVENDGKYETHSVTWTSTVGIDRVWLKAGDDTNESVAYDEAFGPETETVEGNAFSHITFCYDDAPIVTLTAACDDATSQVTVTVTNPDNAEFSYDVVVGDETLHTFTAAGEEMFDGDFGTTLQVKDGDVVIAEQAFGDCSTPDDPAPTVELSTGCDDTQPTATVTIDNDGDEDFSVEVFIDDASQGTIKETTTFDGDTDSVLRVEWGDGESADATFGNCTDDEPLTSTAAFTVGSECQTKLPAVTYDATVSETADDPVGDITLTVSDASGPLGQATFAASEAGSVVLPTALEGATVAVSWDFDDATLQQTLADGCADVLGAVDEREDEPALPTTEVKGEQLPNAGFKEDLLLLLGGGFLALGCSLLLYDRRRYGVSA